jgi:hypothetical protein
MGYVGLGSRFVPTPRITFRVDGGLTLWQIPTPRGWSDPDRGFEAVEEEEWVGGPGLTAGLSIRF